MIRSILLISLSCCAMSAASASADAVVIAAGEHGDFSRLVIRNAGDTPTMRQDGNELEIFFAGDSVQIDLSDINERQKAHRVQSAVMESNPQGSRLRIEMACSCDVDLTKSENGQIVIDIRDAVRDGALSVQASAQTEAKEPATPEVYGKMATAGIDDRLSVQEAQERMIRLLRQAADDGVVRMRTAVNKQSDTSAQPNPLRSHVGTAANIGGGSGNQPLASKASGAGASDARGEHWSQPKTAKENFSIAVHPASYDCAAHQAFTFATDAFENDPLGAIAAAQSALGSSAPEERIDLAHTLARGYLAVGFGEEALSLLNDIGGGEDLLADLARVVSDLPVSSDGPLLGPGACRGPQSLWQAAASPPEMSVERFRAAGDALKELPERLRAILATRLAKKMISVAAWAEAKAAYDTAVASAGASASDLEFIAAHLSEHNGNEAEAINRMQILAGRATASTSADAALVLGAQYEAGVATPYRGYREDIGAVAHAQRRTPQGAAAAAIEAAVWARAGEVEAGVRLLRNAASAQPSVKDQLVDQARQLIAEALAHTDEKARIAALAAILEHEEFIAPKLGSSDFRLIAAGTALDLGLPNAVNRLLSREGAADDYQTALIAARSALEADNPEAAIAIAAPYATVPDLASVLIDAHGKLGRYSAALSAAAILPPSQSASLLVAETAWKARDWASAARAFSKLDASRMSERTAIRAALAAYMSGEPALSSELNAALIKLDSDALEGLQDLFDGPDGGPVLSRGHRAVESAAREIRLFQKALDHG